MQAMKNKMNTHKIILPHVIIEEIISYNGWDSSIEDYALMFNIDPRNGSWFHTGIVKNEDDSVLEWFYNSYSEMRARNGPDNMAKALNNNSSLHPVISEDVGLSTSFMTGIQNTNWNHTMTSMVSRKMFNFFSSLYLNTYDPTDYLFAELEEIRRSRRVLKRKKYHFRGVPNKHLYIDGTIHIPFSWASIRIDNKLNIYYI